MLIFYSIDFEKVGKLYVYSKTTSVCVYHTKTLYAKGEYGILKEREQKKWILPSPMGDLKPCPIITDPQGCYTGRPLEQSEQPVQDADDL